MATTVQSRKSIIYVWLSTAFPYFDRMEAVEMQQEFFNLLKRSLPSHVSMADELSERMGLSHDSVYRRIRGEKPVSLAELKMLCQHYHLSLDQLLGLETDTVVFQAPDINKATLPMNEYLEGALNMMKYFNSFKDKKLRYLCKDMTFFHFFLFPDIAAFKSFFWMKTIQNTPEYSKMRFSIANIDHNELFMKGQQILREYNMMPSVELWNFESINSTISQIQYYRDAGIFVHKNDLTAVIDSFEQTLSHIELQAEAGYKFMPGDPETAYKAPIYFYVNEVVLGTNSIFAELDGNRLSIITYNVLSYMTTKDRRFADKACASFDVLVSRSNLISGTGEKERNKFFGNFRERLHALRN